MAENKSKPWKLISEITDRPYDLANLRSPLLILVALIAFAPIIWRDR